MPLKRQTKRPKMYKRKGQWGNGQRGNTIWREPTISPDERRHLEEVSIGYNRRTKKWEPRFCYMGNFRKEKYPYVGGVSERKEDWRKMKTFLHERGIEVDMTGKRIRKGAKRK